MIKWSDSLIRIIYEHWGYYRSIIILLLLFYRASYFHSYNFDHLGLIERPMDVTVDKGELVTFSCAYRRTNEQTHVLINFLDRNFGTTSPPTRAIDRFTQQRNLSTTAKFYNLARNYINTCTVTLNGIQIKSEATLTINCKFKELLYILLSPSCFSITNSNAWFQSALVQVFWTHFWIIADIMQVHISILAYISRP